MKNKFKIDPDWIGFILGLIVLAILLFTPRNCRAQQKTAQLDTVLCKVQCIDKFVEVPSSTGKSVRIYAVYNDYDNQVSDLIPVTKTVYEYIQVCQNNGVTPQLGIKLKDGQISSIIRFKTKYTRRNRHESR